MTRVITYMTEVPFEANCPVRMARGALLMMEMMSNGYPHKFVGDDSRIQLDYALESPSCIPAGCCIQEEMQEGDSTGPFAEYCVFAIQLIVERE